MPTPKTFRIGIAMAGAVSAGAYTAGVIDYLLETLAKWQEAKDRNTALGIDHPDYDHSVPMHQVQIDVIGGSSAGGMTAAITAMGLFEGFKPVDDNNPTGQNNKLYQAWVNLNDFDEELAPPAPTLEQMLDNEDIEAKQEVASLLNSTAIDKIADRAMQFEKIGVLPPYISPNLEVILTITSLRGLPVAINFFDTKKAVPAEGEARDAMTWEDKKEQPAHRMYVHKGIAHFVMNPANQPVKPYQVSFQPDSPNDIALLKECAKATGAFPLGLKARSLKNITLPYLKAMVYRMFNLKVAEQDQGDLRILATDDPFAFVAVDGGTINNEPFGEVIRAVEEKYPEETSGYAIIMIDPFPNFADDEHPKPQKEPSTILEIGSYLFGAIRSQAMVKEQDLVRGLSSDHTRAMIFPKRGTDPYPIACGSLGGFGGFFSRDFRHHDFLLGRYNCQRFLRKHFNVELSDELKKVGIFEDWTTDDSDPKHRRFYIPDATGTTKGYYPIIPDLGLMSMANDEFATPPCMMPTKPRLRPADLFRLDGLMRKRFKTVLDHIFKFDEKTGTRYTPETTNFVDEEMEKFYGKAKPHQASRIQRIGIWAWRTFLTGYLAKTLTKTVMRSILLDFREKDLLDPPAPNSTY